MANSADQRYGFQNKNLEVHLFESWHLRGKHITFLPTLRVSPIASWNEQAVVTRDIWLMSLLTRTNCDEID